MDPGGVESLAPDGENTAPNGWAWSLLRGFRAGDPAALHTVYRLHAEEIAKQLRFGFSFVARGQTHRFVGYASAFELHDALHETFRRAFEPAARERYDGIRPYGPYLKAIARNVVLRAFRSREVLFGVDGEGPEVRLVDETSPGPEQAVGQEQIRRLVRRFLDTLEPEARRLVGVRFVDGKSQRDAAVELGLGRQQVRTREAKIRARLLAFLREHGETSLVPGSLSLPLVGLADLIAEAFR